MLVEGQIQPICQFHFVFILVHFKLLYRLRWIILHQIGGSQAVFFKMNTLGEDAFLEDVKQLLEEILEG